MVETGQAMQMSMMQLGVSINTSDFAFKLQAGTLVWQGE